MPALRHSQHIPSDVHYDNTSPICTCPTDSPLPDRTPPISKNPEKKRVRSRRVKNQDHIPRPRNAFIIFRSHYINFLKSNHPALPACPDPSQKNNNGASQPSSSEFQQNQLSKIAAKVWNGMAPDERKPYSEEANREKEWHKKMYPDYVYRAPSANTTPTETKDKTKTKNFKIKVKMGDPSLKKRRARAPSPDLPSSAVHDGVGLGLARDQHYLSHTHVAGAEYDEFIPTECIPPLDLSSSCSIEQEAVMKLKFKELCPPLQRTFAVDLSPRSLAYEQYQARVYPDLVDPLLNLHLGYKYAELFGGGAEFEQVLLPATTATTSSSSSSSSEGEEGEPFKLDEGSIQLIDTSFPNVLPYLSSSSSCSSSSVSPSSSSTSSSSSSVPGSEPFYPNFDLDLFSLTSGEGFQVVQVQGPGCVEEDRDGFGIGLDMDLDAPEFNFEMGDGGRELLGDSESSGHGEAAMMKAMEMAMTNGGEDEMSRGLAAWAGYE